MTSTERAALLSAWIKPSSDNEVSQQERAQRMVTEAVKAHDALGKTSRKIYAKGSYANNTNVRRDSDVDIVVQCHECFYFDYAHGVQAPSSTGQPYTGIWTPALWRQEVAAALVAKFGESAVDMSGRLAINVAAVSGSRPSIDVVPSFDYRLYWAASGVPAETGSCVFPKNGNKMVNWPAQQLTNGRAKNDRTGKRYKSYTRALKNAENVLCKAGTISAMPSYLMECLMWNVQDATLKYGTLDEGFRRTLTELWNGLKDGGDWNDWEEPNRIKYLFRGDKKWTVQDARDIVLATWRYLGYE